MTDSLRPSHAASIWVNNNVLFLSLPSTKSPDVCHTLRLPNNVWGLGQVVEILKAQTESSRIGTRGAPTQAQAEAEMKLLAKGIDPSMIAKPKPTIAPSMRSAAANVLRRLGLS